MISDLPHVERKDRQDRRAGLFLQIFAIFAAFAFDRRKRPRQRSIIPRMRRFVIATALLLAAATFGVRAQTKKPVPATPRKPFTVVETTIADMRTAMEQGRVTSRQIVEQYLLRIALYDYKLHAAITVNPKALEMADEPLEPRRTSHGLFVRPRYH